MNQIKNEASIFKDNLQENPEGSYNYAGIAITVDREVIVINRQVYGLLDYLGDIGGLIEILSQIITLLFSPFWSYNFQRLILMKVFKAKNVSVRFGNTKYCNSFIFC